MLTKIPEFRENRGRELHTPYLSFRATLYYILKEKRIIFTALVCVTGYWNGGLFPRPVFSAQHDHLCCYFIVTALILIICSNRFLILIFLWISPSRRTKIFPSLTVNRLMSFRGVIGNYSENYTKDTKIFVVKKHYLLRSSAVVHIYRSAGKSLARPGTKQARNHVRDARGFNNIETRAVINFFFCKSRCRRKFVSFWQKHYLVSFLIGLRTYQHPCITRGFIQLILRATLAVRASNKSTDS